MLAFHTKEEEAFNLHAIHDIIMHGVSPVGVTKVSSVLFGYRDSSVDEYDSLQYGHRALDSNAVPTSFVGSLILACLSGIMIQVADVFQLVQTKFDMQGLSTSVILTRL